MQERSLDEMMGNAQRRCDDTHAAAAETRKSSRESVRLLCRTGRAKLLKRKDESWEAFLDRYAEEVLCNPPREFSGE